MTSSNLSLAGQIGMRGLCQNNFDVCKNNARIIGKPTLALSNSRIIRSCLGSDLTLVSSLVSPRLGLALGMIMLQFFPIILLRIAQKFSRLFPILFSTFFDIIIRHYSLMFTTYSLIMAQVEFGIISIVGKM